MQVGFLPLGLVLGLLLGTVMDPNARADSYWDDFPPPSYFYGGMRGLGGNSGRNQIISLDLDPQNILNSSFRIAARENRFSDVQRFLVQGAEVNSKSGNGETALMFTSRNCSPKAVSLLLNQGAEVNARDFEGRTALMYAAMGSCVSAVELLLKVPGIDLDVIDEARKSAMDYAGDYALLEVGGPAEKIMQLIRMKKKKQSMARTHSSSKSS